MVNDSASSVAGDINFDRPLSGGQPGFSTITLIFLPLRLVSVCLQELISIWTQGFRFYLMVCNSSLSLLISLFITMFKFTYRPLGFPSTSINTCLNKCTSHYKENTEHCQHPQNFLTLPLCSQVSLSTTELCPYSFVFPRMLYKWNHTVCNILRFESFAHSCCSLSRFPLHTGMQFIYPLIQLLY